MSRSDIRLAKKSGISIQDRVMLALFGIVILAGCKPASTQSPAPPTVKVTTVTQGDPVIYQEWIGTLDGLVNAQIRAQVTGYLLAEYYHEGVLVKKGDLLFEIDARPF